MLRMVRNTVILLVLIGLLAGGAALRGHWNTAAAVVQAALEREAAPPAPADPKPAQPLPPGYSVLSRAYEQIKRMDRRQSGD